MPRIETGDALAGRKDRPGRYLASLCAFTMIGVAALWQGNKAFAPEMYTRQGSVEIAEAFASGRNFAVFDLNINIRELRDEHLKRMTTTPDVVVLGASHWQEAHNWLIGHKSFYNAHIHRDYYEDMLGMVEMFERNGRMPKQMIIAIRDNLFTPVQDRKDHLWLPGVPYYEAMAKRLGITPHPYLETAPYQRWRELASLPMFYTNVSRYANATFRPRRTYEAEHAKLDTLLPGGSIVWSHEHQALFTAKRTRELSNDFARQRIGDPPKIDPKGVEHIDRLLQYLKDRGVEVFLAHPPFNPDYYQQVMQGPYAKGLRRVEEITQNFADKYGWHVIGGFNPAKIGCESRMFIDAEHGSPECLAKLFNEYSALDTSRTLNGSPEPMVVSDATTVGQSVRHRIAVAIAEPTPKLHDEFNGAMLPEDRRGSGGADAAATETMVEDPAQSSTRDGRQPPKAAPIVIKPRAPAPAATPQQSTGAAPQPTMMGPAQSIPAQSVPFQLMPPPSQPTPSLAAQLHPAQPLQSQSEPASRGNHAVASVDVNSTAKQPAAKRSTKVGKSDAMKKTVRYPFVSRTELTSIFGQTCSPYVWPGDHAFPDRLKAVCGYRVGKTRG